MHPRKLIATIAVATAFLAFPVIASARVADGGLSGPPAKAQTSIAASPSERAAVSHNGGSAGTGAATVVLIAGLTLLAGAAAGFEGSRIMSRRGSALQA